MRVIPAKLAGTASGDPAAIFAIAISLWNECHKHASPGCLSDSYSGMDGLMREVMRVAERFEDWACIWVAFEELSDVWPYLLEDKFGRECLSVLTPRRLMDFDDHDCARIAARLGLSLRSANKPISL